MNTDFRLSVGYFEHPKIMKLERRMGEGAVLAHIRLLRFASMNKPDGLLTGMDREDVAIASGFKGDGDTFVATLIVLRLLDTDSQDALSLHDWQDWNPWAAGSKDRIAKAKSAASARWGGAGEKNAPSISEQCAKQCAEQSLAMPLSFPILSSPILSEAQGMKDELLGNSSAAAPPQQDKKRVSAERQQSLGQEAVGAYQERYVSRYHQRAELVAGDAASLKDLRVNLGEEKFYRGLDNFMACEHHRVLSRRHAVAMLKGEINVWLSADAIALSYPAASGLPARASPGGMDTSPEARRARNLAYVT